MLIEVLYFEDCPNYVSARENVLAVLGELRVNTDIRYIDVRSDADALSHKFLGSPSIRIDGQDIEFPDTQGHEYAMRCRRYHSDEGIIGYPPKKMIRSAIAKALQKPETNG